MGACVTTSMSITEELLTLSRTMLTSATAQEWEQERDNDARRSLLLAGYTAAAELHLGRDYVETSLREMLAIKQSVLALSRRCATRSRAVLAPCSAASRPIRHTGKTSEWRIMTAQFLRHPPCRLVLCWVCLFFFFVVV